MNTYRPIATSPRVLFSRLSGLCGVALTLAACAQSPSRSDYAEILIDTNPPGANCTVRRADQPVAVVAPTPGIVNLDPMVADGLSVACRRHGYADVAIALPPDRTASVWHRPDPRNVMIPLVPVAAP